MTDQKLRQNPPIATSTNKDDYPPLKDTEQYRMTTEYLPDIQEEKEEQFA